MIPKLRAMREAKASSSSPRHSDEKKKKEGAAVAAKKKRSAIKAFDIFNSSSSSSESSESESAEDMDNGAKAELPAGKNSGFIPRAHASLAWSLRKPQLKQTKHPYGSNCYPEGLGSLTKGIGRMVRVSHLTVQVGSRFHKFKLAGVG